MILVIGRPGLDERGGLLGSAALVALAAAQAGARVELVGSVGDDADGDAVALALAQAGIGHAALLRDPAGATPRGVDSAVGPPPRLDSSDLELGLRYLNDWRALVIAEALEPGALRVAQQAARYNGARLIVVLPADAAEPEDLPAEATLLRSPGEDGGAFPSLVGRYAAALAAGMPPANAWQTALAGSGWSESEDDLPDPG
ncbi:hypothetical protein BH24CHL6_BH24CHL6_09690 [soil metagenome]